MRDDAKKFICIVLILHVLSCQFTHMYAKPPGCIYINSAFMVAGEEVVLGWPKVWEIKQLVSFRSLVSAN